MCQQNLKSIREYLLDKYGDRNSVIQNDGDVIVFGVAPGEKLHSWFFLCDVREPKLHVKVAEHMAVKAIQMAATTRAIAEAKKNRRPAI